MKKTKTDRARVSNINIRLTENDKRQLELEALRLKITLSELIRNQLPINNN